MDFRMVEFVLHQHFEFFHLICHFGQITDIRGYRYVTVSIIIGFDDLYDLICLTENIHTHPLRIRSPAAGSGSDIAGFQLTLSSRSL